MVLVLSTGNIIKFKFKDDLGDKVLNFREKFNECLEGKLSEHFQAI